MFWDFKTIDDPAFLTYYKQIMKGKGKANVAGNNSQSFSSYDQEQVILGKGTKLEPTETKTSELKEEIMPGAEERKTEEKVEPVKDKEPAEVGPATEKIGLEKENVDTAKNPEAQV
jgi:hypothetical protein